MTSLSATKIDLSDPDKFEMASVVTKNSRLGITSNKRLLVIKKGYLYYYSNVPKKFKGDSSIVQTIHQLPKCSIQIVNIKQIKGYQSNSSYFSIEFDEKNMLERQDIRKTMTLEEYNFSPKNSKQNIVWQFTCDNQFVKQRWVAALQVLRDYYNKQKKDIEKFFSQHNNIQNKSSSSGGRNSQVPWRESQSGGNNYKRNNDVNYLQLVGGKSSEDRSMSPDNRPGKTGYLNVPAGNSPSRVRGNSSNNTESKVTQFSKQYSPNQAANKPFGVGSVISASSSQQDLQTANIQNSPINQLQLSDVKTSPTKQPLPPPTNMMFSKTQKVKISQEMIEEQQSESIKTPGPSPLKELQQSEGYLKDSDEFERSLVDMENDKAIKSQPNIQLNFEVDANNGNTPNGKGMFGEINQKQSPEKMKKNEIETSLIQINLKDDYELQPKRQNPQSTVKAEKQLSSIQNHYQLSISPQQMSFYSIHKYLFLSQLSFQQRISIQQQFHRLIHEFSSQCVNLLKSYIQSLSDTNLPYGFQVMHKTNNSHHILYKPTNTLLKIALVTSQSLSINGQEKIYFDEENIKNLKREFKVYNDLEKYLVLGQVKSDSGFRLRVLLVSLVEYKGVVALGVDRSFVEEEREQNEKGSRGLPLNELKKSYQKQIDILTNEGYQLKDFTFLSSNLNSQSLIILTLLPQIVSNRLAKQQSKKSYLKRLLLTKRQQKHHNLQFNPPFTQKLILKAQQTHASTSIQSLEQYIRTLQRLTEFQGICPKEEIIEVLKICVFCKQVRRMYRAAQGEIEETHFLNLILKGDGQMRKILEQSGCDQIPQLKGVLFSFIEHYLGIKCSVNQKALKQHNQQQHKPNNFTNTKTKSRIPDIIQSTQPRAKVLSYDISKIQLIQAYESMRKFISEQKTHLAREALNILENLRLQQFPQLSDKRLEICYFQGSLAYLQHDYLKCIQHCKRYEKLLQNPHDPKLFEVYLLMLKSYSHFSVDQFKHTFQKLIQLIEFNYGTDCSLFISVYSVSAFFFYQLGQKAQHDTKVASPLFLLSFKLMDQAEKLCIKHFGPGSSQYVDLMMDSARLYQTKDKLKAQQYLVRAKTIIVNTQNTPKLIEFFLYELKLTLSLKQYEQCQKLLTQCYELIFSGKFKLQSQKYIEMVRVKFQLGLVAEGKLYLAEQAVEELWKGERVDEKRQAIGLAAKLAKRMNMLKEFSEGNTLEEQSQDYLASSVSSQSFSYFSNFKESATSKIFQILSSSQYPRSYTQNEGLMTKIQEILQEEEQIPTQKPKESLRVLLQQIG